MKGRKKKQNANSLKRLCLNVINKFSKSVLTCIYAESKFHDQFIQRQDLSPFAKQTYIDGIENPIVWYSMPEYVTETFTYLFNMLDVHHLFVNARVKCCSTGIEDRGIKRDACVKVAERQLENKSGLTLALVNDLVDKQSNAFAKKTFSSEVERAMRQNGDKREAEFCKLIREWYDAEDEPGISVFERNARRLRVREWLLDGVKFDQFPPFGSHIKGVPYVMFEGKLTNVERRIQITPFVKTGAYNPHALGSLEVENFFGEFQDLDPSGSGGIRADDIPKALSAASELIEARLNPNRKFAMHTSSAKVYESHQLAMQPDTPGSNLSYMTPNHVQLISPRNHIFDQEERGSRKHGKRKRSEISRPAMTSRGARPIREHHRCDESKVLPHIRLGIKLPD